MVVLDNHPETFLPLQEIKNEFMMVLKQKEENLVNEDTTTRRNPYLNSVIYLTAVKVAQCRQLADNKREKEEAKKTTSNKIATIRVHLQLN